MIDVLIEVKAIKFGDFTLASGEKSDFYVDIKQALLDKRSNNMILDGCYDLIDADTVAGIGLGGTLLVSGMVARKNVNGLVIREKVKNHGTQLALEGPLVTKVVLLEDVITTGQSCEKAIKILSENGISVTRIITVINRKDIDSINHIPVKSLLYSKDLDAKKKEKTICI